MKERVTTTATTIINYYYTDVTLMPEAPLPIKPPKHYGFKPPVKKEVIN